MKDFEQQHHLMKLREIHEELDNWAPIDDPSTLHRIGHLVSIMSKFMARMEAIIADLELERND